MYKYLNTLPTNALYLNAMQFGIELSRYYVIVDTGDGGGQSRGIPERGSC